VEIVFDADRQQIALPSLARRQVCVSIGHGVVRRTV
jgi:hypothetical protein